MTQQIPPHTAQHVDATRRIVFDFDANAGAAGASR
jgi:hypothetical protein